MVDAYGPGSAATRSVASHWRRVRSVGRSLVRHSPSRDHFRPRPGSRVRAGLPGGAATRGRRDGPLPGDVPAGSMGRRAAWGVQRDPGLGPPRVRSRGARLRRPRVQVGRRSRRGVPRGHLPAPDRASGRAGSHGPEGQRWLWNFCPEFEDHYAGHLSHSVEGSVCDWAAEWITRHSWALPAVEAGDRVNFAYLVLERQPTAGDALGTVDQASPGSRAGWRLPPNSPERWPLMELRELLAAGVLVLREGRAESRFSHEA